VLPRALSAIFAAAIVAALLAAPLALPLLEFTRLSSRAALTLAEAADLSLPPRYLLGLLIPNLGGFHEWMTYAGVVPLLLALAGLGRRTLFWAAAALAAALLALGTHFPLYPLLFRLLPGLDLLRVPPRAWFVVALAVCALAGHGAERLALDWLPRLAQRYTAGRLRLSAAGPALLALLALTAVDLLRVGATLLEARPTAPLSPAAAWLQRQSGPFRVYSPSYSLPPGDGLQHLDGVNPLQLAAATEAIERAIGVPSPGYSVTLPAFKTGDLASEHAGAELNPQALAVLNVRYVAAEFPISAAALVLVETFGRTHLYANTLPTERAWVQGGGSATLLAWSPDRVIVAGAGPGRLILSEVAYPGWRATLDGRPIPVQAEDGLWRAVDLPAGEHTVVFEYRPLRVYVGLALACAGLLVVAASLWRRPEGRA
jgi:hypothetical protein